MNCSICGISIIKTCHNCNVGIGHFFDNIDILKNAIKYLEETK